MLSMQIDCWATPVDMVIGRINHATVNTFRVTSAYLPSVTIVPEAPSSNMSQNFGFSLTKLRQELMDDKLVDVIHTPVISTQTIKPTSACSSGEVKHGSLEMLPWHVEHVNVNFILLMDDAFVIYCSINLCQAMNEIGNSSMLLGLTPMLFVHVKDMLYLSLAARMFGHKTS